MKKNNKKVSKIEENRNLGGRPKGQKKTGGRPKNPPKNPPNININKDINKNKNKDKNKGFIIPTLEEIEAYCIERKNNVNAQKFYDYYASKYYLNVS